MKLKRISELEIMLAATNNCSTLRINTNYRRKIAIDWDKRERNGGEWVLGYVADIAA
jgi:hypothetical protein